MIELSKKELTVTSGGYTKETVIRTETYTIGGVNYTKIIENPGYFIQACDYSRESGCQRFLTFY